MKQLFLALSFALIALTSCKKDDNSPQQEQPLEVYVDATSKTTWNYYSLSDNKIVGTGEETVQDNEKWFARTDWDIAINKYNVRTNSGAATTAQASGGVCTLGSGVAFESLGQLPSDAQFLSDEAVTSSGMGGAQTTTIYSKASVIVFKTNDDGSMIMPPVYLQAPVYVFRTADGERYFKVQFTQYLDQNKVSGHVKFYSAQIK